MTQDFDAVIMLTWSDWKTEPRSNRYHYATRFAKHVPVFFLQVCGSKNEPVFEPSGHEGIELVSVAGQMSAKAAEIFLETLDARGIYKPLLWIYNSRDYDPLLQALPNAFRVYHATEDYLTDGKCWSYARDELLQTIYKLMPTIDLLVGVSEKVVKSYQSKTTYSGPAIVAKNGCDAEFFLNILDQNPYDSSLNNGRTVIYQGGINIRVDFDLLDALAEKMPEWTFWFCGNEDASIDAWQKLKKRPNVDYLGTLSPTEFGERMCRATVGIIPFIYDELINNSLPLKAYEYVACGLPVVTVPIEALKEHPDLFMTALNVDEFKQAIIEAAQQRTNTHMLEKRREVARENSYDGRFDLAWRHIKMEYANARQKHHKLNILMLYDDYSVHVNTVREHAEAFRHYSHHHMHYVAATGANTLANDNGFDLSLFDAVMVHYGVRLSLPDYLNEAMAEHIERFRGIKILFIQDEYDATEMTRQWMDRLQFDIVYTCVPAESVEKIYPKSRFPKTDFLPTLTGYVPEDRHIDSYATPLKDRQLHIAYRGRKLSPLYGSLGYDKYRIGIETKRAAEEAGIPVDIEVDDSKRIYGTQWYKFLGSARATLGTESGSNIFDFDGTLQQQIDKVLRQNPEWGFEDLWEHMLAPHEDLTKMNQVSPKIFEAIRLRTALVLFEGAYSNVVQPDVHFIPLKKDFSNIAEVFSKIADLKYIEDLTERAYNDIIRSGLYSYAKFVAGVDADISARALHSARYELFSTPIAAKAQDGSIRVIKYKKPHSSGVSSGILGEEFYALYRQSGTPTLSAPVMITPVVTAPTVTVPTPSVPPLSTPPLNISPITAPTVSAIMVLGRRVYKAISRQLPLPLKRRIYSLLQR